MRSIKFVVQFPFFTVILSERSEREDPLHGTANYHYVKPRAKP